MRETTPLDISDNHYLHQKQQIYRKQHIESSDQDDILKEGYLAINKTAALISAKIVERLLR